MCYFLFSVFFNYVDGFIHKAVRMPVKYLLRAVTQMVAGHKLL